MAKFCLDCFNKYSDNEKLTEKDVVLDFDLCEEYGEWKPCIIRIKRQNFLKCILNALFKSE